MELSHSVVTPLRMSLFVCFFFVFYLKIYNSGIPFFILVHAFSNLVPELLEIAGEDGYFLSDKLNQDPCEEHFGHIRMGGGSNQNPDALQYGYRSRKALVGKAETVRIMGNTRGKKRKGLQISIDDNRQLPKRPKKQ